MLQEALLEGDNVDYREVQFILGRLAALRKPELIPIVIDNLDRLYPIAESVAALFKAFGDLPKEDAHSFGESLLSPILNEQEARPSEYYSMWILSVFQHHGDWDHAEDILKIFRETSSNSVRRFAALALVTSGTRTEALSTKEYLTSASSLCRTAILLASAKLGKDERKNFKNSLQLNDSLERLCIKASL